MHARKFPAEFDGGLVCLCARIGIEHFVRKGQLYQLLRKPHLQTGAIKF